MISTLVLMMNYPLQQQKYFKIITNVKSWIGHIYPYFAQRAETSYARTQVELAQCQYLLPRLSGMWTHLERQKGNWNAWTWGNGD
jgi:GTP-binding protein HflX